MSDFLERVAAERRADVAADAASRDEFALRAEAMTWHRQLGLRVQSYAQRLQVIAEIKRVSPSSGVLDVGVDPSAQARRYAAAGASAISVLVEPRHWGNAARARRRGTRRYGPDARRRSGSAHPGHRLHQADGERVITTKPGRYGEFGGQYLPETLMPAVAELEAAWLDARADAEFQDELARVLRDWVGRPTPLTDAPRLARAVGLARVLLKREDLAHTGAHKINSAVGQALLARRMGKHRVVAETGAGQHGVASAAACALLGLECVVYMGTVDARRQKANVFRMKLLGAEVREVDAGSRTLKDAVKEGIASGKHAASIVGGSVGVLHGSRTLVLQDDAGQIRETHSVSAGLDYPGVGPEHAALARSGRVRYVARTDRQALDAFALLSRSEGIIPALEPAHAIAELSAIGGH